MVFTYKLFNPLLENYYYGYTVQPKVRWNQHILQLEGDRHHCKLLQEAYNKNPKGWKFEIHRTFDTNEKGLKYEKKFVFDNKSILLNSSIPVKKRGRLYWKNGNGAGAKKDILFKKGDKIKYMEYDCLTIIDVTSTQYLVEEEGNIFSIYNILVHKYGSLL